MGEELEAAVTLSRLPGVGARRFIELIRAHGLPSAALAAWNASKESRVARVGPTRQKRAGPIAEWAGRARLAGATTHWAGGPGYPARLLDLSEPPPIVFLRGSWQENPDGENVRSSSEINIDPDRNLSSEDDVKKKNAIRKPSIKRLCIVGSRGAVSETIPWLRSLVTGIADNQRHAVIRWEILSGAAVGIDASAHRAALENGMRTSAVLANGIDISYPACNNILIEEIARSGGLMTELLPGAPPRRSFFPTRNRLLAALADAVIVVQAGENSGSLITAKWAMKLRRPLFVLKPFAETPDWSGNKGLLAAGAICLEGDLQKQIITCVSSR